MKRVVENITPLKTQGEIFAKKRVAAYARVSSGKDAMLHSLSAQVSYYSAYIQKHSGWEYCGVYCDEALSGTKRNRPEFQRMMDDCRAGKLDMVITKSVSRFARNTLMTLQSVRELRKLGVDVYFEEQNIHSLGMDGELLLTLLAAYAQEEAQSASDNQKWRIQANYEQGLSWSVSSMFGFKQVNGKLEIVPDEADILRHFAKLYLAGQGEVKLARSLEKAGVCGKHGGIMRAKTLINLLCNEKMAGELVLQKKFVSDPIEKKSVVNKGERPMYRVTGSHKPIFDRATYEAILAERQRRAEKYAPSNENTQKTYPFTGKVTCGCCGAHYRRKTVSYSANYKRVVWICATFNSRGRSYCPSRQIPEDVLMEATAKAMGVNAFDEDLFSLHVAGIVMHDENLLFLFRDGSEKEVPWQNKSRKESWTDEMRQKAREDALRGNRKNGGDAK